MGNCGGKSHKNLYPSPKIMDPSQFSPQSENQKNLQLIPKEKVLIIIAHRNTGNSFNHRLAGEAEKVLKGMGCLVKVVDLYKIKFNPVSGENDFIQIQNKQEFDYQAEQKYANIDMNGNNFVEEIKEQRRNIQ